jgi:hypothetical protein
MCPKADLVYTEQSDTQLDKLTVKTHNKDLYAW